MKGERRSAWSVWWFCGFLAGSVFLTLVSYFRYEVSGASGIINAFRTFSLAGENNVAAWFTGVMLLVAGLHAYDGHVMNKKQRPGVAKGWAVFTVIFILLSADEVGSIHERIADLESHAPLGGYVALYGALFVFAVVSMWRGGERRSVWLLVLGFVFLGTVPFQEIVEHNVQWGSEDVKALRTVVEEGTELLGILVLLLTTMGNSREAFRNEPSAGAAIFDLVCRYRNFVFIGGALLAAVLAYGTAMLPDQKRGHPADWFAATLFLWAGFAVARRLLQQRQVFDVMAWACPMLCVFTSMISVAIAPDNLVKIPLLGMVATKAVILAATTLLIAAIWSIRHRPAALLDRAAIAAVVALAILSLADTSLLHLYAVPQYLALMVYGVHARHYC